MYDTSKCIFLQFFADCNSVLTGVIPFIVVLVLNGLFYGIIAIYCHKKETKFKDLLDRRKDLFDM